MKAAALVSAVPILISTKATGLTLSLVPSDTEEDNTEDEASSTSNTQDAPSVAKTSSSVNRDAPAVGGVETGRISNSFLSEDHLFILH